MTDVIKKIISMLITKAASGATGIWSVILNYGGQYLIDFLSDLLNKLVRKQKQDEALKKQEEIQAKPGTTVEERAKAYEDVINAGRG